MACCPEACGPVPRIAAVVQKAVSLPCFAGSLIDLWRHLVSRSEACPRRWAIPLPHPPQGYRSLTHDLSAFPCTSKPPCPNLRIPQNAAHHPPPLPQLTFCFCVPGPQSFITLPSLFQGGFPLPAKNSAPLSEIVSGCPCQIQASTQGLLISHGSLFTLAPGTTAVDLPEQRSGTLGEEHFEQCGASG